MDPITLILGALAAGTTLVAQGVIKEATKDAYNSLKALIKGRFSGNPKAELVLEEHEKEPETWGAPLRKELVSISADQDKSIVAAAEKLMDMIRAQPGGEQVVQNAIGSYIAQAAGGSTATVNVNQPKGDGS
jgi:hypothetical protein